LRFNLANNTVAAKAFFRKAFKENGSNKAALDCFNTAIPKEDEIEIRQIKYLNNIVEQDHRCQKACQSSFNNFAELIA
jgi:transposase-like protein